MRIFFTDIARPKAAAKQISRLAPNVPLSSVQEALALGAGYRDWYELSKDCSRSSASQFNIASLVQLIVSVSQALILEPGDVQFALSKARIIGSTPWPIVDQEALYMAVIRHKFLGAPARGKSGTVVRVRGWDGARVAYLVRSEDITHLMFDSGEGAVTADEVVTPRSPVADFLPARFWLPYGVWTLRDGSEVVFTRDYLPLWRISGAGLERLDPWEWIKGIKSERWFAANTEGDWYRPAGRIPALAFLERHRIFELPKLASAMPYLFIGNARSVKGAMRLMQEAAATIDTSSPVF